MIIEADPDHDKEDLVAGKFAATVPMIVVVSTGVLFSAAGCDSGTESPPASPSAPPPSSVSPTVSVGAESDAVAAYRGMWNAFVEAGKTSDPDAPAIRRYATGKALRLIVSALVTNREQKRVIRGDLVIDPRVTAATPPTAPTEVTVLDCVNDEKWLVYRASGGLADDEPGGKHRTTATVTRLGGTWKVSSFTLEDTGTC